MKTWWAARAPREQLTLLIGAGVTLVVLVWLLAWAPLAEQSSVMKAGIAAQRADLTWMQEAAGEVIALRGQGGPAAGGLQGRSLLAVVDQSARQSGLSSALKRVEPEGADKVRVRLEEVAFDAFILWLDQIGRQYGVAASQVSVEPGDAAGRVTARLTLIASIL